MTFSMQFHPHLPFFCFAILTLSFVNSQPESKVPHCKGRESIDDCICDVNTLIENEFSEFFYHPAYSRQPDIIKTKTEEAKCLEYKPLPSSLVLYLPVQLPGHAPKSLGFRKYRAKRQIPYERKKRYRRQILMGSTTNDQFDAALVHLPKKSNHHYVPLGGPVTLYCFGDEAVQQDFIGTHPTFEWTHQSGRPITAPQVSFRHEKPEYTFGSVRLADTDIYNCTVTSNENGATYKNTFQSQIDVVAEPSLWLRFGVVYLADACKNRELFEIQEHLVTWLEVYVCDRFCSFRNTSVTCVDFGDEVYVQLQLAMSTVGFEKYLSVWDSPTYERCTIECWELMHSKLLKILQDSLSRLFRLPIHVEYNDEGITSNISIYKPKAGSTDFNLAIGCPPGFFVNYKLCFPCGPGKYSPEDQAICYPCEVGYFQPNPGASACVRCPKGYSTTTTGCVSQVDCVPEIYTASVGWFSSMWTYFISHWYLMLIAAILLLLLILYLCICCCCPKSKVGRILRCVPCCGEGVNDSNDPHKEKLIENGTKRRKGRGNRPDYPPPFSYDDTTDEDDYDDDDRKKVSSREKITLLTEKPSIGILHSKSKAKFKKDQSSVLKSSDSRKRSGKSVFKSSKSQKRQGQGKHNFVPKPEPNKRDNAHSENSVYKTTLQQSQYNFGSTSQPKLDMLHSGSGNSDSSDFSIKSQRGQHNLAKPNKHNKVDRSRSGNSVFKIFKSKKDQGQHNFGPKRQPNKLDMSRVPQKRPIIPIMPRPMCKAAFLHRRQQELEEKQRNHPDFSETTDNETGLGNKDEMSRLKNKPYSLLGNVLSKSKSLETKLAERRRKLEIEMDQPRPSTRENDAGPRFESPEKQISVKSRVNILESSNGNWRDKNIARHSENSFLGGLMKHKSRSKSKVNKVNMVEDGFKNKSLRHVKSAKGSRSKLKSIRR